MDVVGAFIRISGQYSPSVAARTDWLRERRRGNMALRIMERFVGKGDVVIDIGAAWGLYAWQLARLVGRRGHVHVIEPNPAMTRSLNAIRGGRGNMTIYPLALSDTAGEAELHIPVVDGSKLGELASLAVPGQRAVFPHEQARVKLERLDALGIPEATFIKCDVEGHELAVLRGAERTLRQSRPAVLIEIEQRHQANGADIRQTFDHLLARGYVGYSVHRNGLRRLEEFDVRRDQLAWLESSFMPAAPVGYVYDFLFVRPDTDVSELMATPGGPKSEARAPFSTVGRR